MRKDIVITNEDKFEAVKKAIIEDGKEKLHVVADFDKTITKCFTNGEKIVSLISILRDGNYLVPGYAEKAHALYNKYHQYEIDPNLPLEKKKKLMYEWWRTHYDLLIKSGLSKDDLKKVAHSNKVSLRHGAMEFFKLLYSNNIPFVILSAAGVGAETISLYLERFNALFGNVHIVSNAFIWGEDGRAVGVEEPIAHTFNKDYTVIKKHKFFKEIEHRKNVILLGDSIGDAGMLKGFDYDKVLKIGFLSENAEDEAVRALYEKEFDVLILDDGSMDFVNELIGALEIKKLDIGKLGNDFDL